LCYNGGVFVAVIGSEIVADMKEKIRHAFAVEKPGAAEPTERQREVIDLLCAAIVRRHMTTPAITMLEMSRPMNYLFANAMHVAQPAMAVLVRLLRFAGVGSGAGKKEDGDDSGEGGKNPVGRRLHEEDWTAISSFLEKRGSFDYMCERIEYFEEELTKQEKKRTANERK